MNDPKITVKTDESERLMTVTVPADHTPNDETISSLHEQAGNMGFGIKFVEAVPQS